MKRAFITDILRCFTALVLLAACLGKLRAFAAFRANLAESFQVPAHRARLLAPAVVGVEALLAALALSPLAQAAMTAALLLFAGFTILLAWRLARDGALRCACFGEAERNLSGYDLARNVLVMAAIGLYLWLSFAAPAGPAPLPALPTAAAVLAAALACILAVLAIDFHDVARLLMER